MPKRKRRTSLEILKGEVRSLEKQKRERIETKRLKEKLWDLKNPRKASIMKGLQRAGGRLMEKQKRMSKGKTRSPAILDWRL